MWLAQISSQLRNVASLCPSRSHARTFLILVYCQLFIWRTHVYAIHLLEAPRCTFAQRTLGTQKRGKREPDFESLLISMFCFTERGLNCARETCGSATTKPRSCGTPPAPRNRARITLNHLKHRKWFEMPSEGWILTTTCGSAEQPRLLAASLFNESIQTFRHPNVVLRVNIIPSLSCDLYYHRRRAS